MSSSSTRTLQFPWHPQRLVSMPATDRQSRTGPSCHTGLKRTKSAKYHETLSAVCLPGANVPGPVIQLTGWGKLKLSIALNTAAISSEASVYSSIQCFLFTCCIAQTFPNDVMAQSTQKSSDTSDAFHEWSAMAVICGLPPRDGKRHGRGT